MHLITLDTRVSKYYVTYHTESSYKKSRLVLHPQVTYSPVSYVCFLRMTRILDLHDCEMNTNELIGDSEFVLNPDWVFSVFGLMICAIKGPWDSRSCYGFFSRSLFLVNCIVSELIIVPGIARVPPKCYPLTNFHGNMFSDTFSCAVPEAVSLIILLYMILI